MIALFTIGAVIASFALAYLLTRIARDPVLGLCVFIFLSAITETPNLPVIGDRLIAADGIMMFVILICTANGTLLRPAPAGLQLVDQLGGMFIMAATLSSLLALLTRGDVLRVTMFMLIYIYGYLCFRVILRLLTTEGALRRVFLWWAAAATMVVVVGFLAATGIYRPVWTYDPIINRINSTFKMSGQVASYLGPAMFIFFYLATMRQTKVWVRSCFTLLLLAGAFVMMSTGSRISFAIMALSVLLGCFVILTTSSKVVRRGQVLGVIGIGATVFTSFALAVWSDTSQQYGLTTTSPLERPLRMWSEQTDSDNVDLGKLGGTRAEEISVVIENIDNHMLLGTGSGMFGQIYQTNEVHNTYFSVLAENGLITFMFLLCENCTPST